MLNVTPVIFASSLPDMVALGCGDNAIALIGGLYGCLKKKSANYVMSQSVWWINHITLDWCNRYL